MFFFWIIIILHSTVFYLSSIEKFDPGSAGWFCTILAIFVFSWTYTNARRRAWNVIKATFFGIITFVYPLIGGILYFIFRPQNLVITTLQPSKQAICPVFDGPVWIFARVPFHFLIKLAFWLMGLALLIIGILGGMGKL